MSSMWGWNWELIIAMGNCEWVALRPPNHIVQLGWVVGGCSYFNKN